jgi:hypothetical protein
MVTAEDMRLFSLECLRWAEETRNPSDRDIMVRVARMWMETASALDRKVFDGVELAPDLRMKLD